MAKYELATWAPIPPQLELEKSKYSERTKTQFIIHSAVGSYPGSVNWWKTEYNFRIYSTFFVRGSGEIVQLVDSSYYAPANADANQRAISVETDDNTHPDSYPWNDKQLESLVKLIEWASKTHGIPLKPCPAHDQPGIGFHTMWGNLPRVNPWLGKDIKTCPGIARIDQFYKDILPKLGYEPAPDEEELLFKRWQPPRRPIIAPPKPKGGKKRKPNQKLKKGGARASIGDWNTDDAFGRSQIALIEDDLFARRIKDV